MNESIVRTKIGNCERWRRWAYALSGRGAVSRRRVPLALEWLRQFGIRQRLHSGRGGSLLQQFHLHLSIPMSLQVGSLLARSDYGDTHATTNVHGSAAGAKDSLERYLRFEESVSRNLEVRSSELLRMAVERTRRVENRAATRELVLVRTPGPRAGGTAEEDRRTPAHWSAETSGFAAYSRPPAAPPVNVDQIADTVMRQLDRRIGSWRERMGRI
jgi:hypothetical protein